jgi:uncharacterized membrane protein
MTTDKAPRERRAVPGILGPGLLLGVGLGGFVDGILLHQVLQWHHMLSNTQDDRVGVTDYPVDTVAGLEINTLWDGFFHVATWIAVVVGLVLLWNRVARTGGPFSRSSLLGAVLAGWGAFNLVEGTVDHHLLQVHHVRQVGEVDNVLIWDLGFLALGALLVALGLAVYRRGQRRLGMADASYPSEAGARAQVPHRG